MGTTPAAIDLGELPHGERAPVDLPSPGWLRLRRWAAAGAVVLVLATTAAATPARPWLTPHFTATGIQNAMLGEQHLYVIRTVAAGRQQLSAYRLADGGLAWEVARNGDGYFTARDGLLLYMSMGIRERGDSLSPYVESTTAFDPATGQRRWVHPGGPTASAGGVLVLRRLRWLPDGQDEDPPTGLTAVDVDTGDPVWTLPYRDYAWIRDVAHHLITLTTGGRLSTYDLATGRRLATVEPGLRPPLGTSISDGSVLLWERRSQPRLAVYDVGTLARRWTSDLPAASEPGSGCRTVVCLPHQEGLTVLEPATGVQRWSVGWPAGSTGVPGVGELAAPPGGRPLLHLRNLETADLGWIVDGRSGEVLLELRGWHSARVADQQGRTFAHRGTDSGRTWLGRLRLDPPRIQVLGAIDGFIRRCEVTSRYVMCQRSGEAEVWRIHG